MNVDEQKRAAADAATRLVDESVQVIGLGTGSTAACFVKALPSRLASAKLRGRACVPTSRATAGLARALGLRIIDLDETEAIDLTVDGADEIGPGLSLIKGGGGSLLGEKLVWEASRRCVVIADASKQVEELGRFPLPVEVVRYGHAATLRRILEALGGLGVAARAQLRQRDDQPFVTDGGNMIYDLACDAIADAAGVGAALDHVTGVVEHGLFVGLAECALVGGPDRVVRVAP